MKNVEIQKAIKDYRQIIRKELDEKILGEIMTRAEIQLERSRIGRFDIKKIFDGNGNLIPVHLLPDDLSKPISSIEVKEEFTDPETGITTRIKKINVTGKLTALSDLDEYLAERERDIAEENGISKDATIIENGLQITETYNQDIPDLDLLSDIIENDNKS